MAWVWVPAAEHPLLFHPAKFGGAPNRGSRPHNVRVDVETTASETKVPSSGASSVVPPVTRESQHGGLAIMAL